MATSNVKERSGLTTPLFSENFEHRGVVTVIPSDCDLVHQFMTILKYKLSDVLNNHVVTIQASTGRHHTRSILLNTME